VALSRPVLISSISNTRCITKEELVCSILSFLIYL